MKPTHVLTVRHRDGSPIGPTREAEYPISVYGAADLDRRLKAAEAYPEREITVRPLTPEATR